MSDYLCEQFFLISELENSLQSLLKESQWELAKIQEEEEEEDAGPSVGARRCCCHYRSNDSLVFFQ